MASYLEQSTYVVIRNGCPLRLAIKGENFVEIACGGTSGEHFEFVMEHDVLRELIKIGTAALEEVDAPVSVGASA